MRIKLTIAIGLIVFGTSHEQTSFGSVQTQSDKIEKVIQEPKTAENIGASKVLFFTTYNAGVIGQNDDAPCHSASGKDICKGLKNGEKYVAITKDIRKEMDLSWGDKVQISGGSCDGTYSVEDEMGKRYRSGCIEKAGACKKGDIAVPRGSKRICDGVYTVKKL